MTTITNEYAADLIAKIRADTQRTDEIGAPIPADPRDLLIIKLYDDLEALEKAMGFLGGGIKPVRSVNG